MQGRLSPPVGSRIQAFPGDAWRGEFDTASELGFDSIEFIYEEPVSENPLTSSGGVRDVAAAISATGVKVDFILADIFMPRPLFGLSGADRTWAGDVLTRLLDAAARLDAGGVEIPFVDNSRLASEEHIAEAVDVLEPALNHAASLGVVVGLETDLPVGEFAAVLERIGHPAVRANYDIGNSAALGYDVEDEFRAYGASVANVHVKDRVRGGSTVPLGTGDANLPRVLRVIRDSGYAGPYIIQGARGRDDFATAAEYRALVSGLLDEAAA